MRVTADWHITNRSKSDFAVNELQRYLKQIGIDLPIGEGEPAIIVGLWSDLPDESIPPKPAGHDGYAIAITRHRIVIGGDNERGVIYGAVSYTHLTLPTTPYV